ncbi:MAG: hypothetical protein M0R80_27690 [Proteobacteria bacterium]|jgi:hypothetical protein|nr:hypothetical protein [Pseudomonadota bacterium]
MEKKKSAKIGAGWIKESANGLKYISVKYNNGSYGAIFRKTDKKAENMPDYDILMDEDAAEALGLLSDYKPNSIVSKEEINKVNIDDIPF